jgi:ribonuclease P/MRP protein subunit POP1
MKRGRDGDGDEYVVNTLSFANARAQEILSLSQELSERKSQRLMQSLPYHQQRRQMTFSAKRMPKRMKEQGVRELAAFNITPKPFRHRAFRRRPRYLAANFAKRQRPQEEWLPTHVWHAKRFSTIRLFGLVLPLRPCDRATRAAAKTVLRQCAVYDSTAHRALQLKGERSVLLRLLGRVGSSFATGSVTKGGKSGTAFVRNEQGELVAPVSFLWRSDGSSVLVWVHQSAVEEFRQLLLRQIAASPDLSAVTVVARGFARFDLLGPESFAVLRRVLRPLDSSSRLGTFLAPATRAFVPSRIAFVSRVSDPRFVMAAAALPPTKSSEASDAATLMEFANNGESGGGASCIWDDEQESPPPRQSDIDTRRARVVAQNRGCEVIVLEVPRHEDAGLASPTRPAVGAGYVLVVPTSWALPFWHALHLARARAIGLDDMLRVRHQEMAEPVFPFDFPDTLAGKTFCQENAKRLLDHHLQRPSAKRINHLKIDANLYPFLFPSTMAPIFRGPIASAPTDKDVMIPVKVLLERGKVRFNASLLRPLSGTDDNRQHVSEKNLAGVSTLEEMHELACRGALPSPRANREMVGYVFGGGVSLKRGKGFGFVLFCFVFLWFPLWFYDSQVSEWSR